MCILLESNFIYIHVRMYTFILSFRRHIGYQAPTFHFHQAWSSRAVPEYFWNTLIIIQKPLCRFDLKWYTIVY